MRKVCTKPVPRLAASVRRAARAILRRWMGNRKGVHSIHTGRRKRLPGHCALKIRPPEGFSHHRRAVTALNLNRALMGDLNPALVRVFFHRH